MSDVYQVCYRIVYGDLNNVELTVALFKQQNFLTFYKEANTIEIMFSCNRRFQVATSQAHFHFFGVPHRTEQQSVIKTGKSNYKRMTRTC